MINQPSLVSFTEGLYSATPLRQSTRIAMQLIRFDLAVAAIVVIMLCHYADSAEIGHKLQVYHCYCSCNFVDSLVATRSYLTNVKIVLLTCRYIRTTYSFTEIEETWVIATDVVLARTGLHLREPEEVME